MQIINFMKKITLLFFLLVILIGKIYSQAEYKSLESFNNDTLKYIRYNFEENKERYMGQPFSKFIKEFELTLYYDHLYKEDTQPPRYLYAVRIFYFGDVFEYIFANKRRIPFENILFVIVHFEKPYLRTMKDIWERNLGGIPHYHDKIFQDQRIKDLEVIDYNELIRRDNGSD